MFSFYWIFLGSLNICDIPTTSRQRKKLRWFASREGLHLWIDPLPSERLVERHPTISSFCLDDYADGTWHYVENNSVELQPVLSMLSSEVQRPPHTTMMTSRRSRRQREERWRCDVHFHLVDFLRRPCWLMPSQYRNVLSMIFLISCSKSGEIRWSVLVFSVCGCGLWEKQLLWCLQCRRRVDASASSFHRDPDF